MKEYNNMLPSKHYDLDFKGEVQNLFKISPFSYIVNPVLAVGTLLNYK